MLMIKDRHSNTYSLICLMAKREKYGLASKFLTSGGIDSLGQLFTIVGTTTFSRDAGTSPERLGRILHDPFKFTYRDVFNMAKVLECDVRILAELVLKECHAKQLKKKAR